MIDIKLIRYSPDLIKEGLKKRDVIIDIDKILELDKRKRHIIQELEEIRAEQNKRSKEIVKSSSSIIARLKKLKEKAQILEKELKFVNDELDVLLYKIPNIPLPDVPVGKDERDNVILYEVGIDGVKTGIGESKKRKFSFRPKAHFQIGKETGIIDTEKAGIVSGPRFGYLKGLGAMLELALINFVFNKLTNKNWISKVIKKNNLKTKIKEFIPIFPPVMVKENSMKAMGYIDTENDREERYFLEKDKLFLVGTSEQSIGPFHQNDVFEQNDLPVRYLGFSSCFRREAGSYGKDVRGIMRVHQFDKLEMFSYVQPEESINEHNLMLKIEEELLQELKIPYRVVKICTGDLSRPSAATYDIEAYFPGLNQYKETHSTSNTTDFQARRLNIRYKFKKNKFQKLEFVHMLNGTAIAIGRMILAILENYQKKDGKVEIPSALRKFNPLNK